LYQLIIFFIFFELELLLKRSYLSVQLVNGFEGGHVLLYVRGRHGNERFYLRFQAGVFELKVIERVTKLLFFRKGFLLVDLFHFGQVFLVCFLD
jgi:hypothetical protein